MKNTIALIVIAIILFFLYVYPRIARHKKIKTVQDLIGKDAKISRDGLIRIDSLFRIVIKVWPVNIANSSHVERTKVWVHFRNMMNDLGFPYTMLVQSQYLDLKDYASYYRETAQQNPYLTPEMIECAEIVSESFVKMEEEKNTRDQNCYIILNYDAKSDSIDSGVATGLAAFDDLIAKIKIDKSTTDEEIVDLATEILKEAKGYVFGNCHQMGMQFEQLDKQGVLTMTNKFVQKELSIWTKLHDAVQAQSFTINIESLTKRTLEEEYKEDKPYAS